MASIPNALPVTTSRKTQSLLRNPGIVRNRLKIASAVKNAKAFLNVQKEFGSFDRYIWQFVGGKPKVNKLALDPPGSGAHGGVRCHEQRS